MPPNLFKVVKIVKFYVRCALQFFKNSREPIKFRLWTCTEGALLPGTQAWQV